VPNTPSLITSADGWPQYRRVGECGLLVEFANVIDATVNGQVRALLAAIDAAPPPGLHELIPAYRTLLILYDPLVLTEEQLLARLTALVQATDATDTPSRLVTIPALYGGEYGPDLDDVAAHCGLPPEEVIVRHSSATYLVYFIGFSPGYPYLGGLDPALTTPRLASPRLRVPAGAVAIGGQQTGVYPQETPGGWRLIGRTPIRLYDPQAREPFLLRAGDRVRFRPIGANEYEALRREAAGEPARDSRIGQPGTSDGQD
jgi:KipI family sensor histidine kinase inhibitor